MEFKAANYSPKDSKSLFWPIKRTGGGATRALCVTGLSNSQASQALPTACSCPRTLSSSSPSFHFSHLQRSATSPSPYNLRYPNRTCFRTLRGSICIQSIQHQDRNHSGLFLLDKPNEAHLRLQLRSHHCTASRPPTLALQPWTRNKARITITESKKTNPAYCIIRSQSSKAIDPTSRVSRHNTVG